MRGSQDRGPGDAPRLDDTQIDALLAFPRTLADRSGDARSG
jgi:hypothetical protein